jgi:hypothetical protein
MPRRNSSIVEHVTWFASSFLYFFAFGGLVFHAYKLRNHNRARSVSVIEHIQAMLLITEFNNRSSGLTTDDIESIPYRAMQTVGEGEEAHTCSICLMDFEEGDEVRDISCGHEFHVECLDEWLLIKDSCPNCNRHIVGQVEDNEIMNPSSQEGAVSRLLRVGYNSNNV